MHITGIHPYADEFPLASDEELDDLTASIATVGLIHPIVIAGTIAGAEDGRLVDGRNRHTACERAEVEPVVEVRDFETDDELKEFVIGVNTTGRRDSMTAQIAAASTALILGEEKRINGQWRRGALGEDLHLSAPIKKATAQAGFILDTVGRNGLHRVRDGESLNSVYVEAEKARDAQRDRMEHEQRLAAEEDDAHAFIEEHAPDLASRVDGEDLESFVEARDLWNRRNREEAERIRKEKLAEEDRIKAERLNDEQQARMVCRTLEGLEFLDYDTQREWCITSTAQYPDAVPTRQLGFHTPERIRHYADMLHTYASELESSNAA